MMRARSNSYLLKYTMNQHIAHITILIDDYDRAIYFYTNKLGFKLIEDRALEKDKRWVVVAPPGNTGSSLLLARADSNRQKDFIGNQSGGRVFLFLYTDDFWRDYHKMVDEQVQFVRRPKEEPYGTVAVFKDLYGNLWDLIQPSID